jgi:2-polyprenyl-6-methoxyphenol hydroxylase-like FAD-dependent oxidoreductase
MLMVHVDKGVSVHRNTGRAVVLGGGMAGLLAAHMARSRFDEVVVVERDQMPPSPDMPRRGTPQARHAHALLAHGQHILEDLFPGFTEDCRARGAPVGDVLMECRMYFGGHRLRPTPSELTVISASRTFLERRVRERVSAAGAIAWQSESDATGLVVDGDRVIGVRLVRRSDGSGEETLDADLVVDATGRTSRAPAWLEAAGFGVPVDITLQIDVAYATRRYRMDRSALDGDIAIVTAATPSHPRVGVLAVLEDGVGMLTLGGVLGDKPPRDPVGFTEFASRLAFPDIASVIEEAMPIDDPVPFRFPASRWRRFDRLDRMPAGFVAIGDSVVSLNPIYGQGMTVAAQQSMTLREHLAASDDVDPLRLHRAITRVIRPAWDMAAGADLSLPGMPQRPNPGQRIVSAYVKRMQKSACTDPALSRIFGGVSGLVAHPASIFKPSVMARIARAQTCSEHPSG